jgi:hypothetical protein
MFLKYFKQKTGLVKIDLIDNDIDKTIQSINDNFIFISLYIENSNDIFDDKFNYDYKHYNTYTYSNGIFKASNRNEIFNVNATTIKHIQNKLCAIK